MDYRADSALFAADTVSHLWKFTTCVGHSYTRWRDYNADEMTWGTSLVGFGSCLAHSINLSSFGSPWPTLQQTVISGFARSSVITPWRTAEVRAILCEARRVKHGHRCPLESLASQSGLCHRRRVGRAALRVLWRTSPTSRLTEQCVRTQLAMCNSGADQFASRCCLD